ncbi:MAG TPA: ComEA family DNA-binding protein [Pseudomonadales bacterium]
MSQSRKFSRTFAFITTLLLSLAFAGSNAALAQAAGEEAPLSGDLVQVNINEADAAEIADSLVGIGMSRAQAIVQYREEHGQFTSLDDLVDVKGVGEATIVNNKDRIRFE